MSYYIDAINQLRAEQGIKPLIENPALNSSAQWRLGEIMSGDFSHYGAEGAIDAAGDWLYIGENLAQDYTKESKVVDGWVNSPSHARLIFSPLFTETGVATRRDETGFIYVVQHFATENRTEEVVVETEIPKEEVVATKEVIVAPTDSVNPMVDTVSPHIYAVVILALFVAALMYVNRDRL